MDPWSATPVVKHFPKDQCDELDIGSPDHPRQILVSKRLTLIKRKLGGSSLRHSPLPLLGHIQT